jgi:hypothetical protein
VKTAGLPAGRYSLCGAGRQFSGVVRALSMIALCSPLQAVIRVGSRMFNKFSVFASKFHHLAWCAVLALTLGGCGGNDTSSTTAQSAAAIGAGTPTPIIRGVPRTLIMAGSTYSYVPFSSDPNERVLSYDIVNKPEWAAFNETNGELIGTPEARDVGTTAEIEIGVSDGTKRGTVGPFHIRVIPQELRTGGTTAAGQSAPAIAGTPSPSVTAGQSYRFKPAVTDPSGEALSFTIVNRPAWATFNTATGALSGTPNTANVGNFSDIVVSVSASGAPVSLSAFSIEVLPAANNAPTISGTPAAAVAAGSNYSFTPVAGDPDGNALTFSILNVPSWASFNTSTGELSGTAPATATASISSNIVISVSDGSLTASLPVFSIEVQATSGGSSGGSGTGGNAIKFHPGHYIELDPGSGGGGLTGWLATIASLKGATGVKGVVLIRSWSNLEFAENVYTRGSGSSARGFAMIDQLLAACHDAGLQFMLGYEDRSFGAAQTYTQPTSFGALPTYFDTLKTASGSPGYVNAPSGKTLTGSLVMTAKITDPAVTARAIALVQAYGARYDSNPNFEMFRTPETANASFRSSSQFDAYVAQLQAWMAAARAAFPHTGLSISANFMDTPAQFTNLFATARSYAIGIGGPDVKMDLPGNPAYPGTSNLVFNGYEGGTDYRGVLPWVSEVQTPDESGVATPSQLYNEMMTGSPATGGSMNPNYIIWSFDAGWMGPNAFTNSQILAFIASVNGAANSKQPSTYP